MQWDRGEKVGAGELVWEKEGMEYIPNLSMIVPLYHGKQYVPSLIELAVLRKGRSSWRETTYLASSSRSKDPI